ncbi:NUDIX domain-containing protein [Actinoplanes sp. CA-252034]|uniref:NUDIX domain-containing protein n=1 Tax=Actinoplanes sp. CA-252034 TaxID=3239906 RepID=UPI003D955366
MSGVRLPPAEYYAGLPRNITGAGVILHDEHGRFLLVRPSYRADTWEIPGGGLDEGENPWQAARREVEEETGLRLTHGRLLAVDWVPAQPDGRPALANFLFDGGRITQEHAEQHLILQADELTEWRLAAPHQWDELMSPHMARRLHACADALRTGTTAYLHHGWNPFDPSH